MQRNRFEYTFESSPLCRRKSNYALCAQLYEDVEIVFDGLDGTSKAVLSVTPEGGAEITIENTRDGVFQIPARYIKRGVTLLMDLTIFDERDEIVEFRICEPLRFESLEDKAKNAALSFPPIERYTEIIAQHAHQIVVLEGTCTALTKRVEELEKRLSTFTEVVL